MTPLKFNLNCDVPRDAIDSPVDVVEFPKEIVRIEVDSSAATANVVIVRLHPSDSLLAFLAALRARKGDNLIVENRHGVHPSAQG